MVNWEMRPYREGDEETMAATATAGFQGDGLDFVVSAGELQADLQRFNVDLRNGTLIVTGPRVEGLPEGMPAGYGVLGVREDEENDERVYQPRIAVHPAARPLGLERELVLRLIEMARANETEAETVPRKAVKIKESFSPKQVSQKEIYEELGLKLNRVFWTMNCPLDDLPEARPVEGVQIRPLRLPEDTWPLRDALNGSFIDHYDFHPPTPGRWEGRLSRHSFRPDLSWVGEIEGEPGKLAGFCLCGIIVEENEAFGRKEGWIETLGTIRGWRGKGLGRALLLQGLRSLKSDGMDRGALGVDSENPTGATQLYESVGFRVADEWLSYGCLLSEIEAAR
jgi:ribosomal protein S18 acetylase RimI-like enzyme